MTAKPAKSPPVENTSNINPNILAAVTHSEKKPLVEPEPEKPVEKPIEKPKIETKVSPKDLLIEKLKAQKIDEAEKCELVPKADIEIESTEIEPVADKPLEADEPIKEKKKKKKQVEPILQEQRFELLKIISKSIFRRLIFFV